MNGLQLNAAAQKFLVLLGTMTRKECLLVNREGCSQYRGLIPSHVEEIVANK
jgi:hypothetical protein